MRRILFQVKWTLCAKTPEEERIRCLRKTANSSGTTGGWDTCAVGWMRAVGGGETEERGDWRCRQEPEHEAIFKDFIPREIGSQCRVLSRGVL